ncbi:hypothetical protein BKA83DRAFT_4121794 [Pisolithus microcarpus]|nr:hypothetical protein BKA83DRAFT_4121794 [Pisolithus microcarpus]
MAIPEPPSTFGKPGPCTTMSSGLDTPQLSTKACAGSYSHPSSSIVPETPDASISYSQQIIPAPPSSSAPRILSSNTGASLIRGTPAAIGLFRAPKSLITLPPHTTPFPYRNYALSFAVRSPMHAQNVPVQAENVSTEDEGGQVGEEEEEEEHAERDEAKLVLEVARAQRKICRVEQQLSTARLEEIDALGNLYRFRAELAERKLQYADFDLGHVRHSIRKNGVSLCDLPSTRKRHRMSDNGVTGMVAAFLLTFEHSRDTAIRMRSAGAKDSDDGEDETTRSSNWAEQKGWRTEGESTFLVDGSLVSADAMRVQSKDALVMEDTTGTHETGGARSTRVPQYARVIGVLMIDESAAIRYANTGGQETNNATDEDLKVLRKATPASPGYIPPCALVGLITLGTTTQVHELGYVERSKSYVFRGDMLGLSTLARAAPRPGLLMPQQALGAARFLLPMQWVEFQLTRATYPNTGACIVLFSGGPATEGPGMVRYKRAVKRFLRIFNKDNQDFLEMGLDATFGLQEGIHLCWRDANQYREGLCVETERRHCGHQQLWTSNWVLRPGKLFSLAFGSTQFVTHSSAQQRLRVTATARNFAEAEHCCFVRSILLWDTLSKHLPLLAGHTHRIYSMRMVGTQNAHNQTTSSTDGSVCSWLVDMLVHPEETLVLIHAGRNKTGEVAITTLDFPDNETTTFWVGTKEGNVYQANRYDRAGAKAGLDQQDIYKGHAGRVMRLRFHPLAGPVDFSDLFLAVSMDRTVKLWRAKSLAKPSTTARTIPPVYSFDEVDDYVYDAKWHLAHPAVFGTADGSGKFDSWNSNNDTEVSTVTTNVGTGRAINKLEWDRKDGRCAALGCSDGKLYTYDIGDIVIPGESEWTGLQKTSCGDGQQ